MALIVLASASGAPGVSTTALGLAMTWPRRVLLVDADPVGASPFLAGWFKGEPPHHRGLINLAMAGDRQELSELLASVLIPLVPDRADLVAGVRSPAQAGAVHRLWPELGEVFIALESTGTDVVVDAGRLGQANSSAALIDIADAVLLTTRATLPAISAARGRARELLDHLARFGHQDRLGLLLVGAGRTFSAKEVQQVLAIPLIADLPWDPHTADTLHLGGAARRWRSSPLTTALGTTASSLLALTMQARARAHVTAEPWGPRG